MFNERVEDLERDFSLKMHGKSKKEVVLQMYRKRTKTD